MKQMTSNWDPIHSHVPQRSLIENVSHRHLAVFPEGFFQNKWLDDKRSIQNMFKDQKFMNDTKLPSVAVSYEIDDDPKNTLEQGDWPYTYAPNFIAGKLKDYYWRIYRNPYTKTEIYMVPVRMKITLTFRYLFADVYTRDDVYRWMLNKFRYAGPPETYGAGNVVYAVLPTNMLGYLRVVEGFRNPEDPEQLKAFNVNLMQFSKHRLTLRKVSSRDATSMMFVKYELPNMQIIQTNKPEKEDGEQKGQTKTNFGITETLEFEPYVPQLFILNIPEVVRGVKIADTYKPVPVSNAGIDNRVLRTRNYYIDPTGKALANSVHKTQVISNIEFFMDSTEPEVIPIDDELYGWMHLEIMKVMDKHQQDHSQYYRILLFCFESQLQIDQDYVVDWTNRTITILHPVDKGNYRLVCCARRELLEPYMRNILIHNPDYFKYFPRKIKSVKPIDTTGDGYHQAVSTDL